MPAGPVLLSALPARPTGAIPAHLYTATLEPPKPQYRTREVIFEYGFARFREEPGAPHEFGTVTSPVVGWTPWSATRTPGRLLGGSRPEKTWRTLRAGLRWENDRIKEEEAVRRTCFLVLVAAATAVASRSQTVACPETITVTESAEATGGWHSTSTKADHPFARVSVYNGKQGAEEYDLAPDDEKASGRATVQTWVLKDYRSMNLFLRCRYHDTSVTLAMDLPAQLDTCTFTFEIRKDGTITGKPAAVCR